MLVILPGNIEIFLREENSFFIIFIKYENIGMIIDVRIHRHIENFGLYYNILRVRFFVLAALQKK